MQRTQQFSDFSLFSKETIKCSACGAARKIDTECFCDFKDQSLKFQVIYQTRDTVFHRDIQTPRRELKIRRAAEYF